MSHYKSNLRDIEFNLFEVFAPEKVLGTGPFADIDADTAREILHEVDRLAREDLAPSFGTADRTPPVFDPESHTVTMPTDLKQAYRAYMDAEWYRLELPAEAGGQPVPATLKWSLAELVLGANPPVFLYSAGPAFAGVVYRNGNERDRLIARHMIDRVWGATMVLTEPDAGSDVGVGRTRALPQPDGSWHIEGTKRFITSAEHDMSENIIHLVLARPVGVEDAGGPGTKGLSLFIVPKYDFDLESGELTGGRNGAFVTGVEHKMGIRASTTCEITFGETVPARGWLLGEVHDGIAQMFKIIEHARMMVGTKAMATLSTGYLNALDYAKSRVQGADLAHASDKAAPRVTITHHPDVRRSLLTQKSYAEALRALVMYTATYQDRVMIAREQGRVDDMAEAVNDLLLPIVKGYCSERAWVILGTESLQTLGGQDSLRTIRSSSTSATRRSTPCTKAPQPFRGSTCSSGRSSRTTDRHSATCPTRSRSFWLSRATGASRSSASCWPTGWKMLKPWSVLIGHLMTSDPSAEGGDIHNIYKVGLNTTRLLMALGDLVCSYLMLRQAEVALIALAGDVSDQDAFFYEGKVAAAQFFARNALPRLAAERAIAEATDLLPMDLAEGAF